MFDVDEPIEFDEFIVAEYTVSHEPFIQRFLNNDEIKIVVEEDLCTKIYESSLQIDGEVKKEDGVTAVADTKFVNNGPLFLFSEICYEINNQTVSIINKPGITCTLKGLVSFNAGQTLAYSNAGWFPNSDSTLIDAKGKFSVVIPLKFILGFAEDYRKVIVNMPQQLVLIRANDDSDAFVSATEKPKVSINRIVWNVKHSKPGLEEEVRLTRFIEKGLDADVAFRQWDLFSYPPDANSKNHT
jgi:hypothetical protein